MSIRLIAFDLDGTLLTSQKKIDERTKASIQKAMEQGVHIALASGRDRNGCRFVYEPLGLENGKNYLALINGQIVYDFESKEYDLDDVLSPADGLIIQTVCQKYGLEGIFCCGYDFYSYLSKSGQFKKKLRLMLSRRNEDYGLATGKEHRNFIQLDGRPYVFSQDINKVCCIRTPKFFEKHLDDLKKDLSAYDLLMVGNNWLEIMPKGVSKASALEKIARKNGFTMNEVMAFGDAQNDIGMLSQAGIGVAMGNGMKDVKEIATLVTDTNDNNGIGKVIDALLEGKEELLRNGNIE
jgi:hypothetical protein